VESYGSISDEYLLLSKEIAIFATIGRALIFDYMGPSIVQKKRVEHTSPLCPVDGRSQALSRSSALPYPLANTLILAGFFLTKRKVYRFWDHRQAEQGQKAEEQKVLFGC
jgi:hypothetical protein